ncbi:secondary thiamine-phosphate synthase enzyme YjbQ [Candidatus Micrarchaeota archaeon]|nr:secondary thiamine-phosphate synthase enzyme YjbQ [Candidatus Micrarchaeota archaeon]
MKSKTEYLVFNTKEKVQFINITTDIRRIVQSSGIKEGLVLVNPMHITSAVIVNDDEQGLIRDFKRILERLVPYNDHYDHNVGEDNGAAHIWRQFMGHQIVMPITKGELDFGPWEQIFYAEFDGMREKRVLVKIIGE